MDRLTGLGTLGGFVVGALTGWVVGFESGTGRLASAPFPFLAAGGAEVPALIFAIALGSLFGLLGALWDTMREAQLARHEQQAQDSAAPVVSPMSDHAPPHGDAEGYARRWLSALPIYGASALAVYMGYTLAVIMSRAEGAGAPSDQANRVTWNQKNVTRLGGRVDAETELAVQHVAFPSGTALAPRRTIIVPDDWRVGLALTPLVASPTDVALVTSPVASPSATVSPGRTAGRADSIRGDAATIAAAADSERTAATGRASAAVLIVSADGDARWALPAGAYAARTGTPILFVTNNALPPATSAALGRRDGRAAIYVLGPDALISGGVLRELGRYGRVTRIAGVTPEENAVRFAEFFDPATAFGWGRTGRGPRQFSSPTTILVNGGARFRWQDAVAAVHLARRGKSGPLLYTNRDAIPSVVANYLWRQRPAFANTPEEGPYAHVWAVGSFDRISYLTQANADYDEEIEQYMTLGDSATSGAEALAIAWLVLSIASAVWICVHARVRIPEMMPMMRAAWSILALLLGPLAVGMYIASYHRRPTMRMHGMTAWRRGRWGQTIVATAMMFAFDMMLMCLAVFWLAERGFPIIRAEGPLYILGTSMMLMMLLMYAIALALMLLVFHAPMTMHEKRVDSYWKALALGAPVMVATMSVESLGMMPTMWWAQMSFLPSMQMPTADDVTMWGTLLLAVFAGFVVVLPFNYWLVARGTKTGSM